MASEEVTLGTTITANVDGDILTIRIKLNERHGQSSSGKSTIVASTGGNLPVPGHDEVKIGINVYVKA